MINVRPVAKSNLKEHLVLFCIANEHSHDVFIYFTVPKGY